MVYGHVLAGRLLNPQASQTKGSDWTGRYLLLSAGYGLDRSSCHEEERGTQKTTGFPAFYQAGGSAFL
jgi:hypothetical protein